MFKWSVENQNYLGTSYGTCSWKYEFLNSGVIIYYANYISSNWVLGCIPLISFEGYVYCALCVVCGICTVCVCDSVCM